MEETANFALMDNSAFAGVMRLCCPDVAMHKIFLRNYPEHREIDEQSLADFLTAIVIYEGIVLDSRSVWNDKELQREGYKAAHGDTIDGSTASWVEQLRRLLPGEIAELVATDMYSGPSSIDEDESTQKAFDVMCSPLKNKIILSKEERIPRVYYAKDYVYRPRFEQLNESGGYALEEDELAQAMFLHRGIFLQARSHDLKRVYLPYYYRGKMLAQLPPMIWVRSPEDGNLRTRLPLEIGHRPDDTEYIRSLNQFYYSLLESVSWTTYSTDVPFIGAAILAKAKGQPNEALSIAMELRTDGKLRSQFARFERAIRKHDRPEFETLLKGFRSDLKAAARHLGAEIDNPAMSRYYSFATCWLPKGIKEALEASVALLPESIRDWGHRAASLLLTKNPVQMLFIEHIQAIRDA
jgi:hypothetical protein